MVLYPVPSHNPAQTTAPQSQLVGPVGGVSAPDGSATATETDDTSTASGSVLNPAAIPTPRPQRRLRRSYRQGLARPFGFVAAVFIGSAAVTETDDTSTASGTATGGTFAPALLRRKVRTYCVRPRACRLNRHQPAGNQIWIDTAAIMRLPTNGGPYNETLTAANSFTSANTEYDAQSTDDMAKALAAALISVRNSNTTMRDTLATAIDTIASNPFDKANLSPLGWARTLSAWVVAADIIELRVNYPAIEDRFQSFLSRVLYEPYSGDGGSNLVDLTNRANNIGCAARCATTVIAIYIKDLVLLQRMYDMYVGWLSGPYSSWPFDYNLPDGSWQSDPATLSTYRGIIPVGVVRDGNNFDGIIPDDYRRNGAYNPVDFPGPSTTKYPWEAFGFAIGQAHLLERNGYAGALGLSDKAPLRAIERLHWCWQVNAAGGWTFGNAAGGASDDRWMIHYANSLYHVAYEEPTATAAGRPFSWTAWAFADDIGMTIPVAPRRARRAQLPYRHSTSRPFGFQAIANPAGSAAVAEGNDTSTASGSVTIPVARNGFLRPQLRVRRVFRRGTARPTGLVGAIIGSAAVAEGNDTSTASGSFVPAPVTGSAAATETNDTSTASGIHVGSVYFVPASRRRSPARCVRRPAAQGRLGPMRPAIARTPQLPRRPSRQFIKRPNQRALSWRIVHPIVGTAAASEQNDEPFANGSVPISAELLERRKRRGGYEPPTRPAERRDFFETKRRVRNLEP